MNKFCVGIYKLVFLKMLDLTPKFLFKHTLSADQLKPDELNMRTVYKIQLNYLVME